MSQEVETSLHESLRDNVRLLGDSLGRTIAKDLGSEFVDRIERIRALAKKGRQSAEEADRRELIDYLRALPERELLPVTRAFNQFLNFSNIAEQHYRARFRRVEDYKPGTQPDLGELLKRVSASGQSPRQLVDAIAGMRVDLVLTAHPTEVIRRTLIQKYDAMDHCLQTIEDSVDHPEVLQRAQGRLEELIAQSWHTDEIRQERPTPVDEAKWGFAVIENSLWDAVPTFHRDLDALLMETAGERLPLEASPIRFASWMGGDRDGNPNVTASVTEEVLLLGRWMAADLYLRATWSSSRPSCRCGRRTTPCVPSSVTSPKMVPGRLQNLTARCSSDCRLGWRPPEPGRRRDSMVNHPAMRRSSRRESSCSRRC